MRFSLLYLPTLTSNDPCAVEALYREILAEVREAEETGPWDTAWIGEHHFCTFGGIIPSNSIFGAALAMATRRIRIGAGVAVLPLRDALRTAEEFAMLDVLSGGRLEMGVSRGFMPHEFEGLGIDFESRHERFEEGLDIVRLAWTRERFSYAGKHYRFEDLTVLPKPVQRPHPPLWLAAALSRESFRIAGQQALHLMLNPYTRTTEELAQGLQTYREAWEEAGHPSAAQRIMVHQHLYVAETVEQAREEPREALLRYLEAVNQSYNTGRDQSRKKLAPQDYDAMFPERLLFGTSETLTARIRDWEEIGITDVCCNVRFGELPTPLIRASMQRFAADVMPNFPHS